MAETAAGESGLFSGGAPWATAGVSIPSGSASPSDTWTHPFPPPRNRGPTYRVAQESARIIRKSPVPDRPACPYERGSAESCLFGDVLSTFRCSQFWEKSRRELPQRRTPRKMHLPFSISLSYKGNTISAAGEDIDASRFRRGGTKRRRPAGDGVSEKVEEV